MTTPTGQLSAGRQLHCLDIENLLGGPHFTRADVEALREQYLREVVGDADAQVTVATSHTGNLMTVAAGWPEARHVWGAGRDGADRALLEVLGEDVAARFGGVVIASGDRIFARAAGRLAGEGCHVTVVGPRGRIAKALRLAATEVHETTTLAGRRTRTAA